MRYKVLISISLISFITITCEGVGISSKLDFGDAHSPKIVGIGTQYRSVSTDFKHTKKEETKSEDNFEGIGVVCVSGGCNKTKSEDNSKDSVETDVVVHVKTSVDLNKKNKTNIIDETPDVPIIVGTAGITDDSQSRAFDERPYVVTDFNGFTSPGPLFSPSVGPAISSSDTPSFVPSYSTYDSPSLDTVYMHSPNIAPEPRVDINIKPLPSVSLTMTQDGRSIKDIRYKTNGLELRYPYFEPSFHNHYFGESPPPQLVWYPKSGLSNTVDYKPKTAAWKPSLWSGGTTGTQHRHTVGSGTTCTCKNQPNTGLQWYPARKSYQDPGRQIDDKLSELN